MTFPLAHKLMFDATGTHTSIHATRNKQRRNMTASETNSLMFHGIRIYQLPSDVSQKIADNI